MTITDILQRWNHGDGEALNELMPVVEERLHELAENRLRKEVWKVVQPTELINEVYLKLAQYRTPNFRDRDHFFGAAAGMIRRILVDVARREQAGRRDRRLTVAEIPEEMEAAAAEVDLVAMDDALEKLAAFDARAARIVELRYFGGLTIGATARVLKVSPATVKRDWDAAKVWLRRELS